ncbi:MULTISPECIES: hypothetical protein [Actinokineospora]|uniref:Uncharacterized protein n=1 Tax=Actinokineospora fastidiosa TaxID=1816 RepID=A0A918GM62_9PSEU|nr:MULTISPECIES: hypothetical protein [Actinokineospora]UVS77517.1 hypothetical protein Actkin_01228 [Actinokineospora sp. UTMC 2448]GGS42751.1 hypothetical protein GCM10010171_42220 [Actinokineospora fastidiosa]
MGWLRRSPARTVTRGRSWRDPILDAALAEAEEGRLGAARTVLGECRDQPEIRVFRVGELAEALIGFGDEIATIAGAGDADLLLLSGAVFVREAWAVRGAGRAETVGAPRFRIFHNHLAQAVAPLRAAAGLLPGDPVPWSEMDPVARGLEFDRGEQDALWAEIASRCPTMTVAVRRRLQSLAPKWGGDETAMIEFARASVAAAPPGHPVAAVIAEAQFEGAAHRSVPVARYARAARAELVAASTKLLTTPLSLPQTCWAHNAFAAVFSALDDAAHAVPHLRAMNDHLNDAAWAFVGGEAAYQRAAAKYL